MRKYTGRLAGLLLAAACLLCSCGERTDSSSLIAPGTSDAVSTTSGAQSTTSSQSSGTSITGDSDPTVNPGTSGSETSSGTSGDTSEPTIPPDTTASSTSSGTSENSGTSHQTESSSSGNTSTIPPDTTSKPATSRPTTSKPTDPTTSAPTKPPVFNGTISVKEPVASGRVVYAENGATIDASNASEGYIMVKCRSASRLKLQVIKDNRTYNYDLNNSDRYEVFSLPLGSGDYRVRVMENTSGSRYRQLHAVTISVSISNAYSPFLYPNQYISFTAKSQAVKKSYDLCVGADTDLKKIEKIYAYVTENIRYDYDKVNKLPSTYLPDVDDTIKTGKGICFDYAALVAAMLRAQNIPTKLVVGTVSPGELSHAWNLVYTKERGWLAIKIYFSGGEWKLMDATFGANMGQGIEDYIGDGSQYTQLRVY